MFGIIKNNNEKKIQKKYNQLLKEAYQLSKVNRKLSDEKYAEAEKLISENKKYFLQ